MTYDIQADFDQLLEGNVPICLDMETAMAPLSFMGRKHVRLLQLLSDNGEVYYDLQTFTDADWVKLHYRLAHPDLTIVGQNLFFDYRCLLGCGIRLHGRLHDTMIQSALLNNGLPNTSNSLEAIALRILGLHLNKELQKQDWMAAELDTDSIAYAMGDVRATYAAWQEMRGMIKHAGLQEVYDLECSLIPAVVEMEHTGMLVDQEQANTALSQLAEKIESSRSSFLAALDSSLQEAKGEGLPRDLDGSFNLRPKNVGRGNAKLLAGFNLNSPAQVLSHLNAIGIDPRDPKTGKSTTDKKVLRPLADDPVVYSLLEYKRAEKRRSMVQSWLDKNIEGDGRIHARFAPLTTGTGRFSCSAPNLQQVPRESYIRDCFVAPEGYELVVMDVKNMEMGVACCDRIADEFLMQKALRNGTDLHTLTAHLIFGVALDQVDKDQRQRAKSCNFGLLYGSGAQGLKDYFASFGNAISLEEATRFRKAWLDAYPAMAAWHQWAKTEVDRRGEVRMVDGRRRWLVGDMARPTVLLNNVVQGTAASIVKRTMVRVKDQLPEQCRLIAQVHDELICEVPEGLGEEVLDMMKTQLFEAGRQVIGSSVDMIGEGSVAKSWGQAK
ncbi:MAG: DNA polymerase [Vulcanococcus sp.]